MQDTLNILIRDTISTVSVNSDKLWGISFDALASTIITIIVFILGVLSKYLYDKWKNAKRLKNISYYFKSNIKNLIIIAEKEIDSLNDIIFQLSRKKEDHLLFKDNSSISFDFYNKLSHVDLFEIFLYYSKIKNKENNIDQFISTTNDIESLKYLIKHSRDNFINYYNILDTYFKRCVEAFKQVSYTINDYKKNNIQNNIDLKDDRFLAGIISLAIQYNKQVNPKDINIQYEHFIKPLIDICNNFTKEIRSPEIIKHAMDFAYNFDSREKIKMFMISFFQNNIRLIKGVISKSSG